MRVAPLLALVLFSAAAHGAPDAGVERVLATRIDGDRSGVCVVAVRIVGQASGGFTEQRADRCASTARSLPASPGYRFEIGSISKAFTGVLLSEMRARAPNRSCCRAAACSAASASSDGARGRSEALIRNAQCG